MTEKQWMDVYKNSRLKDDAKKIAIPENSFWNVVFSPPVDFEDLYFPFVHYDFIKYSRGQVRNVFLEMYSSTKQTFAQIPELTKLYCTDHLYNFNEMTAIVIDLVGRSLKSMKMTQELTDEICKAVIQNCRYTNCYDQMPSFDIFMKIGKAIESSRFFQPFSEVFQSMPSSKSRRLLLAGSFSCFVLEFAKSTRNLLFFPSREEDFSFFTLQKYHELKRVEAVKKANNTDAKTEDVVGPVSDGVGSTTRKRGISAIEPVKMIENPIECSSQDVALLPTDSNKPSGSSKKSKIAEIDELSPKPINIPFGDIVEKEATSSKAVNLSENSDELSADLIQNFPASIFPLKGVIECCLQDDKIPYEWKIALISIIGTTKVLDSQLERAKEKYEMLANL